MNSSAFELPKNEGVSLATIEDVDRLLVIQNENLIVNKEDWTEEEKASSGFLVHPLSKSEFVDVINNPESHILIVARENQEVVGYILSYDLDEWKKQKPDWENSVNVSSEINEILKSKKVLYMRHIARSSQVSGVGKVLLQSTFREGRLRGYDYAAAEILKEPITNVRSTQFSEKQGLHEVGTIKDGERLWILYLKQLKDE